MAGPSDDGSREGSVAQLVSLESLVLERPEPDCSPVAYSADADNNAIVVWRRGTRPDRWLISRQADRQIFATVDTSARSWHEHIFVQPLPDGEFVLASMHCAWRPSGPDRNAVVIDASGNTVAEATIGNGINQLLADSTGRIWVGYSDEGVYGNQGWNHPGPEAIGAAGLVRFDRRLEKTWEYQGDSRGEDLRGALPFIDDCYALNVTNDRVLAYVYSDFYILDVQAAGVSVTNTDVHGASELLFANNSFALLGGYEDDSERVSIGVIEENQFVETERSRSRMDRRPRMGPWPMMVSRGPLLHKFAHGHWSRYLLRSTAVESDSPSVFTSNGRRPNDHDDD